jgi:D-galactosamine 6-phosphate deaminase/isomerase
LFLFTFIASSLSLFFCVNIERCCFVKVVRSAVLIQSTGPENGAANPALSALVQNQREAAVLLRRPQDEQQALGYFHTLREILQQPATWLRTGDAVSGRAGYLSAALKGVQRLMLTGSGSSQYAGECLRLTLQQELCVATETIAGGDLLTHGGRALGPGRPGLLVSLARSGDSPESVGAVEAILAAEPAIRHLVITCNAAGRLATTYADDPRVDVMVLDDATNDRSLVMTSSFTNMVLAGRFLGMLHSPERYRAIAADLSRTAESLFRNHLDAVAGLAHRDFRRMIFLADGPAVGAARECALKMTEMTAGRVVPMQETYLGLRHGPMSGVHADTLIVCFLASDPLVRAYEVDLIRELDAKGLGMAKLLFGVDIPADLVASGDVAIEPDGLRAIGDESLPILDVVVGQLLAFFRCLKEGLTPDSPSNSGVIHRVVQGFTLYGEVQSRQLAAKRGE